jgi:hypothetical protein
MIFCLTPDQARALWPRAKEVLDRYLPKMGGSSESYYNEILKSHYQLWFSPPNLWMVTAVVVEEGGPVLEVLFLGGERGMRRVGELEEALEEMQRHAGCRMVQFETRRRARRILARRGFKELGNGIFYREVGYHGR